ncbi:MAG: ethanolamine utilization protein EutN [Planctomycetota bacterium]|jgi:ethanolamine utilization protein EutN|nr:MAG: ethanolamine utilization protein EutN [Planctomycetota bacterium]
MQLASVIGRTNATIKHPALNGWRLLIVQPLDLAGGADGEPVIAIDNLGASVGGNVMFTADGAAVKDIMGRPDTPVRFAIIGLVDD